MADSLCDYRNSFDNYFKAIILIHSPELKFSGHYMIYLTGVKGPLYSTEVRRSLCANSGYSTD